MVQCKWPNGNDQSSMACNDAVYKKLKSVASSQGPIWPVPNMNRSKKNEFCQKVSNYFLENGALFKYNQCTDRVNKEKICKYIPSFLICSRNE